MSGKNLEFQTLKSQAENTLNILEQNQDFYYEFKENDFKKLGRNTASAMVFSQLYIDFYTCVEKFLVRVSHQFENHLQEHQWHKDLLYKMTLSIENVRPAVIGSETYYELEEVLRFRHSKRYYFNFNYDWEKLEFIEKKYHNGIHLIRQDLNEFIKFLDEK